MIEIDSNKPSEHLLIYQANDCKAQIECRFEEGELARISTIVKYATVQIEGSGRLTEKLLPTMPTAH